MVALFLTWQKCVAEGFGIASHDAALDFYCAETAFGSPSACQVKCTDAACSHARAVCFRYSACAGVAFSDRSSSLSGDKTSLAATLKTAALAPAAATFNPFGLKQGTETALVDANQDAVVPSTATAFSFSSRAAQAAPAVAAAPDVAPSAVHVHADAEHQQHRHCLWLRDEHGVRVGASWGSLSRTQEADWMASRCDRFFCEHSAMEGKGTYRCIPLHRKS
jgi:hypothetical protein